MLGDDNLHNHEVYDSFFASEEENKRMAEKLSVPLRVWILLPIAMILCIGSVFLYFNFKTVGFVLLVVMLVVMSALWIFYFVTHHYLLAFFASLPVVGLPNAALGYWANVIGVEAIQLLGVPIGILALITFIKAMVNFQE